MAKCPFPNATTASLGFEAKLWQAADALRNKLEPPSTSTSSRVGVLDGTRAPMQRKDRT